MSSDEGKRRLFLLRQHRQLERYVKQHRDVFARREMWRERLRKQWAESIVQMNYVALLGYAVNLGYAGISVPLPACIRFEKDCMEIQRWIQVLESKRQVVEAAANDDEIKQLENIDFEWQLVFRVMLHPSIVLLGIFLPYNLIDNGYCNIDQDILSILHARINRRLHQVLPLPLISTVLLYLTGCTIVWPSAADKPLELQLQLQHPYRPGNTLADDQRIFADDELGKKEEEQSDELESSSTLESKRFRFVAM